MAASGLDLQAVAVRIKSRYANISNSTEALLESLDDAAALLVHVRALRAALQPFAALSDEVQDFRNAQTERHGYAAGYVACDLKYADLGQAASVLGAAQDGETPGS